MNNTHYEKLNKHTAWIKGQPITSPSQMLKKVTTEEIDSEWLEDLKISNLYWFKGSKEPYNYPPGFGPTERKLVPRMLELRERILSFAGKQVCMPFVEDEERLHQLETRGQIWYGEQSVFKQGAIALCHLNSAMICLENKMKGEENIHMASGYALSEDGMWRQHSWCVEVRESQNVIIETTDLRTLYFGYVLDDTELMEFILPYIK
ncbi:hypothetical protein bcgnr5390_16910 [Bacillus luti]|nr:hypothetical protein BC2903_54170 [Bacillus cereus]